MSRLASEELVAQRRKDILEAAERVFAERGYHEAGIADIAAELGMGHGTFYRYFKNKHDIAVGVVERVVTRVASVAMAEDPTASDTLSEYRAQTERILTGMLELTASHPVVLRLFHEQLITIAPDRLAAVLDSYADLTTLFLKNGVDKGFLRPGLDIRPTAEALVALIFEGTRRALRQDAANARRWVQAGVDLMFTGVALSE